MVSASNTQILFSIVIFLAGTAFILEQKTNFGKKISGVVIAMFSMMVLANFKIVPVSAPSYDFVYKWIVPMAIPMFLFKANIVSILKETGKTLIAFVIGGIGTVIGAVTMFFLLGKGPEMLKALGLFTATYIGGTINFVAISEIMKLDGDMLASAVAADNVVMAIVLIFLFAVPASKFAAKIFNYKEETMSKEESKSERTVIYAENIVYTVSISFIIAAFSMFISSAFLKSVPHILISTVLTVILATAFPKFFGNIQGSEEIGIFFMYLFFAVVGASARFDIIIEKGLVLFVYASGTIIIHLIVLFAGGKLFKIPLPELLIASNANIGGPTTACGMAMAKKWNSLIVPAVLVGLAGYITATVIATIVVKLIS
jgi:uncharacterized membrane protein